PVVQTTAMASAVAVPGCPKLRYVLAPGPGWTHVTIAPWLNGDVTLVEACGVTLEAGLAQAADSDYRKALQDLLLDLVQDAVNEQPTHQVYLDANTTYEIRAEWQWQGFRPAKQGDQPPPTSSGVWTDAKKPERFRFSTAAFGLAPALPPDSAQNKGLDLDPAQGGPGYD